MIYIPLRAIPSFPNTYSSLFSASPEQAPLSMNGLYTLGWLYTVLVPGAVLCTIAFCCYQASLLLSLALTSIWTTSPSSWVWLVAQSCASLVASIGATYVVLVLLVELVTNVVLRLAGAEPGAGSWEADEDPNTVPSHGGRRRSSLYRCIERSLVKSRRESRRTSVACCAICLDEISSDNDQDVVRGVRGCCKSSVFHKACIEEWLKLQDSCPCCRQPMLVETAEHQGICPKAKVA